MTNCQQKFVKMIFFPLHFLPLILRSSQHLNEALYWHGTNAVGSVFRSSFVFSYGKLKSKKEKPRKRGQKSVHFSMRLSVHPLKAQLMVHLREKCNWKKKSGEHKRVVLEVKKCYFGMARPIGMSQKPRKKCKLDISKFAYMQNFHWP